MGSVTIQSTARSRLRIIAAIAGKDIVDALRNKTTLTIMIGVAMIMLTSSALPLILRVADQQRIGIYDAGSSPEVVAALRQQDGVSVLPVRGPEELQVGVSEASDAGIGVVLPADWAATPPGVPLELDAYIGHWIDAEHAATAEVRVVTALEAVVDRPVTLLLQPVYPAAQPGGNQMMMGLSFTMVLLLVSVMLVPMLIIEEKENHTLETLLVSPATMSEMVIGKALAGLVFGIAGTAVFLAFNYAHVVHWGIVVAAVLAGGLFATCLGLLLGVFFDNQGTLNLWVGLILVALLAPTFGGFLGNLPGWAQVLFSWIPSTGLLRLFWLSLTETVEWGALLRNLGLLASATLLLFAVIVLQLRRLDR